jgi:hypothetical protein
VSYIGASPTTAAFVTDQFSANGSGTVFTLSTAPANTNSILVAVSGVLQSPDTYSVSGTTLTFSAAPPAGTGNISVRFLGIPASGVVNTAYRTQTEFTATAGQTTFSVPSYTVGFIDVYRNGALLGSADFTATNGTTVVLANPASSGDLVETISFFVSSVLNAIPNTAGSVISSNIQSGVTINFADGSASTPSITNDGDTNTGIFFPAADTIAFSEGGTEQMRLDSAGNLQMNSGYGSVATAYGCRAWVNFNGVSGTSIRGSGNISSVTRSSAGRYDVNFTNAMPDANYAVSAILNGDSGTGTGAFNANGLWGANNRAVGSLRVEFYATSYVDSALCDVAIFR